MPLGKAGTIEIRAHHSRFLRVPSVVVQKTPPRPGVSAGDFPANADWLKVVHGSKAKFRLLRGVACRAARSEELADRVSKFLEESRDHFGRDPKIAGRTFTGGSEKKLKAEGGDRKAAPLGIQIRRSRNALRVPLLEFSFRVGKKRRVQAWRLGLRSGGKERAPLSSRVARLQIPIRVHLLEFAVHSHSRGVPIPQWLRFIAPLHRGSPSLPPRPCASAGDQVINYTNFRQEGRMQKIHGKISARCRPNHVHHIK